MGLALQAAQGNAGNPIGDHRVLERRGAGLCPSHPLGVVPTAKGPQGRAVTHSSPPPAPGTAEPALTESHDRLHLQHGVPQARVQLLHQALLVGHGPVQALLPVLGDKEFGPVVGNDAAFAARMG